MMMKQLDLTQLLLQQDDTGAAPKSAVDRVYDDLYRRIVSLELPPDTTLTRGELCKDYGVSQMPIRGALQRLEDVGLVKIYPQSRTVVSRIEVGRLNENHFLREALECEVVRRLALKNDAELTRKLFALVDMQAALVGDNDQIVTFSKLDELFHRTMFTAVGQVGLYQLIRSKSGHMARARLLDLPAEGKQRDVVEVHRRLVEAIASGDPEQATATMRRHLDGTIYRIEGLRESHPDYFTD